MNVGTENVGLKLVSALLLHHGKLSVRDIQAMPLFLKPNETEAVVEFLLRTFDAEIYSQLVASEPIPEWERIIRLRK